MNKLMKLLNTCSAVSNWPQFRNPGKESSHFNGKNQH